MSISIFIFILLAAIIAAFLEIQIEGPAGWAKNLPTWRSKPNKWYTKLLKIVFNKDELTGYHLALWALLLLFFHAPLFWGINWSLSLETDFIASFFLFWVFEDFLWFVLNPAYGIKKFRKQYIPWHKHWWGPFPREYYISLILILILYII